MQRRNLLLSLAFIAITGCASTPNPIDANTRGGFFVKEAVVDWKVDDAKQADNANYQEGKKDTITRLKAAVENEFKNSPSGSIPATFKIEVKNYSRVGAAVGNMIGGSNYVGGDVHVIRQSDGAEIGVYKNIGGVFASNGGILGAVVQAATKPDIVGIMTNTFAQNLRISFESK